MRNWKERILDSLGKNGALLIDVIPKLQLIIGPQPQLKEQSLIEIQTKFSIALQNLLKSISSQSRPIALFIDDLQWVDTASLELFEKVLYDNSINGLMFICTYRENEVDILHPLFGLIKKIEMNRGKMQYLHLVNLDITAVTEIISNVLNCDAENAYGLSKIVHEKTFGNPFYIIEFLKYCNEKKLLYYDVSVKRWMWNESGIRNCKTSDNVVDFLIEKMKTLPKTTKRLVMLAACIGNRFDIKILTAISGKSLNVVNEDLKPAITGEMIFILGNDGLDTEKTELQFCHDKFQQAAYYALSDEDKKIIHMNIAKYYENMEWEENAAYLFLQAEQYSKVLDCITVENDIKRVSNIFLNTAQTARHTSAFDTARKYLELIINNAPMALKKDPSFIQPIYTEYHLVLFSLAAFEELDIIYGKIEKITENPLDLVNACCVQLISLSNRSRYKEAFYLGISLLEKLGISYPENNLQDVIKSEIEKFYFNKCNGSITRIEDRELLHTENDNAIAKLLNRIVAASLFFNPSACFWSILVSTNLMIEKGPTNWALEISSAITLALVPLKNDFNTGYNLAKNAISVLQQKDFSVELYRMYHVHSLVNCHWFEPLETGIYYAHKSFKGNLENGEFEFSCFSFFTSQTGVLECSNYISEVQIEIEAALEFSTKTGNKYALESFASYLQFLKVLKGKTVSFGSFNDKTFNEEKHLNNIIHNGVALSCYYIYRALSALLFDDFKGAYVLAEKAVPYLSHVAPFYIVVLHRFVAALSICKIIEETENLEERQLMQKTLDENQEWMYQRAMDAPFNFLHLYLILIAEIKSISGKYDEAFIMYEKAMSEAKKNKRPYHYALICEITGQRYMKMGIIKAAGFYIKEAYSCFSDWEATGKAEWMKDKYKDILFSDVNLQHMHLGINYIDLKAILNVSQTISGEIEREKLLEKLMEIVMQNSGSTLGHILLKDEANLILLVSGSININLEMVIDHKEVVLNNADIKKMLPVSMINYVTGTKEVLTIDSIPRSQFAYDNYFEGNSIQSAICLPILQQNVLKGVVYLENNMLSGAFTKNNIDVLKMISSQAAISIENAFLYTKLENKVKERTYQLEEMISKLKESNAALEQEIIHRITTEEALKESERQINYSKEYDKIKMEFFTNISHELRTPINVIFSALQMHELKLKDCANKSNYKDCNKYDSIMKQNCYRLLRLINNLIDITKIDTGYFDLDEMNIDIISLIENITLSVADYIENKGLSLIFDTDVEEKVIACDPEKIERIILNLLSNAVKFTPKGGKIQVNMEDCIDSICIKVKDNGRGIPKEKLNSIFERFVQVDKSFTRDHEGSGIGLSLVKALVELHGGTISVKSSEGLGTEFIICIPNKLVNETYDEIACCEEITKSCIEKINIEFSDIYK